MLHLAISNTKQKLNSFRQSAATTSNLADGSTVIASRSNKRRASPVDARVLTPKEKKQIIRHSIRLPRPQGGNLIYSAAETVDVVSVPVRKNDEQNKHSPQFYLDTIKQKMIGDVRVPVQQLQLNNILMAAKDGKTLPAFNNDCLLRPDGAFVWSDRTRAKLGDDKEKRMRFLLQMMQPFYALMIGNDAAIDGIPFQQHPGQVRAPVTSS